MAKNLELLNLSLSEELRSEDFNEELLNILLEKNDTNLLVKALGELAKAQGMTKISRETGIGRESLYKALREGANPRCDTVIKVIHALGYKIVVVPKGG